MKIRCLISALLALSAVGCGGEDGGKTSTDDDDDGDAHEVPDGGSGDGDGDGGAEGGGDEYPGFRVGLCQGDCPYGACGDFTTPPCYEAAGYDEKLDADWPDYCRAGPSASYCVSSSATGPGSSGARGYCINCEDGEPSFQHCAAAGWVIRADAECMDLAED